MNDAPTCQFCKVEKSTRIAVWDDEKGTEWNACTECAERHDAWINMKKINQKLLEIFGGTNE